jgi:hypothetical protein
MATGLGAVAQRGIHFPTRRVNRDSHRRDAQDLMGRV